MIDRRTFSSLLAGAVAAPGLSPDLSWGADAKGDTVLYASIGPELTLYGLDLEGAALLKRGSVKVPANIQYAWPHPSRKYFYIVSSNGGPNVAGDKHHASITPALSGSIRNPARSPPMASRGCCRHGRSTTASTAPASTS
jgi:6-phosphogluconolactonase